MSAVLDGLAPGLLRSTAVKLAFLPFGISPDQGPYPSLPSYAPGGLIRLSPDGRILHATPALAEILGHEDVGALIGANVNDFCTNTEDGRRLLLRLECENSIRDFEVELRRLDGVSIFVRFDGRGFRGRNGQLRYSEALVQDISALRRMESSIGHYVRALEESEKSFRRILESSLDALAITAYDDGTCLKVNREFEELTGFRREEMLGRPVDEFELCADGSQLQATLKELADGGIDRNREVKFRRKDGTFGWAVFSALRIDFENRSCILWFARDMTSRKRGDHALQQSIENESASSDLEDSAQGKRPFVLVVDADSESRRNINTILDGHYEVLTAANEGDARSLLAAHVGEIEIILMDVGADEDGLRLTRALREQDAWTNVPIIATMARALPEDEKKVLAAGCNGYLVKPFCRQEVLAGIEDLPFRPAPIQSGLWKEWRRFWRRLIRQVLR